MEEALGADGHDFLEQHDALIGLVAEELQGGEAAGRRHVEMLPATRGYDKAFCCGHVGLLLGAAAVMASPDGLADAIEEPRLRRGARPRVQDRKRRGEGASWRCGIRSKAEYTHPARTPFVDHQCSRMGRSPQGESANRSEYPSIKWNTVGPD